MDASVIGVLSPRGPRRRALRGGYLPPQVLKPLRT